MDERLTPLLARQLGLVTTGQARSAGLSADALAHCVARGDLERIGHGLYRLLGTPPSWEQDVLGVVLMAGPAAWASHATAARLWGCRGFADGPVEVTVHLARRPRVAGARVHRSGTLEERDLREMGAVPTLSFARTAADLSMRLDVAALGALVDDGLRRGVLSLRALDRVVRRLHTIAPGRSPKRLVEVLTARVPGYHPGDSELETQVLRILVDAGLPEPVRQCRVVIGDRTYFLDLAYPERKLAIEVDGFDFHRGRGVFDRDRVRQNDLVRAGWTLLRFTSSSTADEIVASVRELLFGR